MAVCDMQTVLKVLHSTTSLITDRWVRGEFLWHAVYHIRWMCAGVTILLTCGMTTLKLVIVKYPLRTGEWSSRLGHTIWRATWILGLCWYTPQLVMVMLYLRDTIHFTYTEYNCCYCLGWNLPSWSNFYGVISFLLYTSFCCISTTLLVSSTFLLVVAKRVASWHREPLRWEGATTVLLTVTVLLPSNSP